MTIDDVMDRLRKGGVRDDQFAGCDSTEVAWLEEAVGLPLPDSYKEFLLTFGRSAGKFGRDFHFFLFDSLRLVLADQYKIRRSINASLEDGGSGIYIVEEAFFFAGCSGNFWLFDLRDRRSNPPGYVASNEGDVVRVVAWSFTEFLVLDEG